MEGLHFAELTPREQKQSFTGAQAKEIGESLQEREF